MKRITVICIAILVSLLIASCGGTAGNDKASGSAPAASSGGKQGAGELGRNFSASIEETVLLDDIGVKITAKDLSYTNHSAELQILLENNSDQDLKFLSETLAYSLNSVNGYMMPIGYVAEDIASGMSATKTISISFDELSMYGISDIADITMGFVIQSGNEEYLKTGLLEIRTSAADGYDYSKDTFAEAMDGTALPSVYGFSVDYRGSEKLLEEYGLTIEKQYVITNKDGEKNLFMEVVNDSENNLYVASADVCVNGMSVSSGTWDSESISAGKRGVLTLEFDKLISKGMLELLRMKKYTDCSMVLKIVDEKMNTLGTKEVAVPFDGTSLPDKHSGAVVYDKNGYTFQTVGLMEDPSEYSDDVHALVLMKNTSGQEVYVSTMFNDVYANKTKVSDITYGRTVKDGGYALIDISLTGNDLQTNGLDVTTITEVSTKFDISDGNYHTYDEPEVTLTF